MASAAVDSAVAVCFNVASNTSTKRKRVCRQRNNRRLTTASYGVHDEFENTSTKRKRVCRQRNDRRLTTASYGVHDVFRLLGFGDNHLHQPR